MKKIKLIIVMTTLTLITAGLNGCTCENLIQRAEKKCGTLKRIDTITVFGTITTEITKHDTIFKHINRLDTLVIRENNLLVKYFYNTKDSLVYLGGKCDTVRVKYLVKVPYTKTEIFYSYWNKYKRYFLIIFFSSLFISLVIIFVKIYMRLTTGKK